MFIRHKAVMFLIIFFSMLFVSSNLYAQTGTSSRTKSSSKAGIFSGGENENEQKQGQMQDFIVSIIGSQLRHPNPRTRLHALQTFIGGMSGETTDSGDNTEGMKSFFSTSNSGGDSSAEGSTGMGGSVFIPDLYVLLADPDPEIRDIASVGLDMIFGTDVTLMRMMNDEDPVIRNYATKVYTARNFSENKDSGDNENNRAVYELLALRTLLIRLKHEENPEVRKTISDALDWYVLSGGENTTGDQKNTGKMFGTSAVILTYLHDENPEVRINAIKIVSSMDYNQNILQTFMEMLKTEKDKDVKSALLKAIDSYIEKEKTLAGEGAPGM